MTDFGVYLLQTSLCIGAFYVLYLIFFRKSTFFRANRTYLMGSLLLSFVIPFFEFSSVDPDYHLSPSEFLAYVVSPDMDIAPDRLVTALPPENVSILGLAYWIGFGFMLLRFLLSIGGLVRLARRAGVSREESMRIVRTGISQPFSFFNLIFLPMIKTNPLVLEHEKAHVRSHHWIDLILIEIAGAILWFNPMMIFYKRSIKIQHEYEADSAVISNGISVRLYLDCILHQLQAENLSMPVSQFYSQNIKNRIVMITRKKTPFSLSFLYVLFVPMTCLLLFAFAKPSVRTFPDDLTLGDESSVVIVVDAGHGGNDTGSASARLHEKEFALAMAKNIQKAGEANNIKVILTRTDDEALGLKERVAIAKRYKVDAFISIHANYDEKDATSSGIECVVSEKNGQFEASERLAAVLLQELRALDGISVNGIKKSNAYILAESTAPAILLEIGYLSNESDNAYVGDTNNQQKISERIVAAVLEYTK